MLLTMMGKAIREISRYGTEPDREFKSTTVKLPLISAMQKILTNDQIRHIDLLTIEKEGIESEVLMERAGRACFEKLSEVLLEDFENIIVFAGVGNNGGDALVVARYLHVAGFKVRAYVLGTIDQLSPDCRLNLTRLKERGGDLRHVLELHEWPQITLDALVIDGIFGSGLNRPVEGFLSDCITRINDIQITVISIDIPSGMFPSQSPKAGMAIVRATQTIAFETPKLVFFMPDCSEFVGEWVLVDTGLDQQFIDEAECINYSVNTIDSNIALSFSRKKFDHKGTFGHAMIVAGSRGKMGAAVLATKAALSSGCGLTTAMTPKCGEQILQISAPEAMCLMDSEFDHVTCLPSLIGIDALGIGPGLGQNEPTVKMLESLLKASEIPMVIDADALNIMASIPNGIKLVKRNSILTPNVKEFECLFGTSKSDLDRIELLRSQAKDHGIYIILKGAHSALATPSGEIYFNNTGNPGMATGGSGDVLTGIITGLLAQSKNPFHSALVGMYIHGLAGDIAAERDGQSGLLASDIIDHIGLASNEIFKSKQ